MTKKINAVEATKQSIKSLQEKLLEAKTAHETAKARCQELTAEAARIGDALTAGGEGIDEEQVMDIRQRQTAAGILAEARSRAVADLAIQLQQAEQTMIGEQIRAEADGYVSVDQLCDRVESATADFLIKLNAIAAEADERSFFIEQSIQAVRRIDGGSPYPTAPAIGGVRRNRFGYNMILEVDGKAIPDMPSSRIYAIATEIINNPSPVGRSAHEAA